MWSRRHNHAHPRTYLAVSAVCVAVIPVIACMLRLDKVTLHVVHVPGVSGPHGVLVKQRIHPPFGSRKASLTHLCQQ